MNAFLVSQLILLGLVFAVESALIAAILFVVCRRTADFSPWKILLAPWLIFCIAPVLDNILPGPSAARWQIAQSTATVFVFVFFLQRQTINEQPVSWRTRILSALLAIALYLPLRIFAVVPKIIGWT